MALNGCYACMKYLVIAFNLIFWLAGIGVLTVAVWLHIGSSDYWVSTDRSTYSTALYILMAVGIIMTLVGFLGCCGALRESPCMLGTFFILLLILFAAEVTGGVYIIMYKDDVKQQVNESLTNMLEREYGFNHAANKSIDAIQHDLECCGAGNGPGDWQKAMFFSKDKDKSPLELGISAVGNALGFYEVPRSCCIKGLSVSECDKERFVQLGVTKLNNIYQVGCVTQLQHRLEENSVVVLGVGIGIAVLQILGLIFSLVTCCAIRNGENFMYKA